MNCWIINHGFEVSCKVNYITSANDITTFNWPTNRDLLLNNSRTSILTYKKWWKKSVVFTRFFQLSAVALKNPTNILEIAFYHCFSIDNNVNISSPCSKTVHTKFTKPLSLYPTTQKVAGYYVIPSELWVSVVRPSVCPSALRFRALNLVPLNLFSLNFA